MTFYYFFYPVMLFCQTVHQYNFSFTSKAVRATKANKSCFTTEAELCQIDPYCIQAMKSGEQ